MTTSEFFKVLTLVTIGSAFSLYVINQIPAIQAYQNFSWISCTFFVVLNLVLFFFANMAAKSRNKQFFMSSIVGSVLFKMLFSIVLVFVYNKTYTPQTKYFLIPFLWMYLVYTIFETYFMTKLGKTKSPSKPV